MIKFSERGMMTSLVKASFYDFVVEFWSQIVHEPPFFNWHVKYICEQMQEIAERIFKNEKRIYDLVINVPPGSTKSTVCSQMFPAWCWTRMPSMKFINASYAYTIALKDSLRTRDLVQSDLYQECFPEIQLREDENTKGLFVNTLRGFRLSAGVGGAVTGYHGHVLTADDPINPEESFSEAELLKANRWMEKTLPSRRIDKEVSAIVLVMQRLHQADPAGEMLERLGRDNVKHINLPGERTDKISPKSLARNYTDDGLLDPVRLSRKALDTLKLDLGEYGYASQILQDPVPLGGGMFKTGEFKHTHDCHAVLLRKVRSWDKASTSKGGAYTAGVLIAVDVSGFYWVLDVVRGQWDSTMREQIIRETALADGYDTEIVLELEGGSGGKESGESTIKNLAGFRVTASHPTGDKEARAYPLSSQVGAGNVYILDRPWTKAFLEEFRYFPQSRNKDQVDAASGGFNRIARKRVKVGGISGLIAVGR